MGQRCPVDRKTIAQALAKMARQAAQPTIKLVINNFFLLFNLILKPPIQYLLTDKHINRMMKFTKTTSTILFCQLFQNVVKNAILNVQMFLLTTLHQNCNKKHPPFFQKKKKKKKKKKKS